MRNWKDFADVVHQRWIGHKWIPGSDEDKRFLVMALAGEVGELANFIKKEWRGDGPQTDAIFKEMADIRIYLEQLARAYNCDLDAACEQKLLECEKKRKMFMEAGGKYE